MSAITADEKLRLYNNALLNVGERFLASLDEAREPRYLLDLAWDSGAVDFCLEQGQWNFAMRTSKFDFSASVQPPFGYQRAFAKPGDWIRTAGVCSDEFFRQPLLNYTDEASYWFADLESIYVRYVSNDNDFGLNVALWPQSFTKVVHGYLATEIVDKLTQDKERRAEVKSDWKKTLLDAKSKDAMDESTKFAPPGTWTTSRRGRRGGRWDRGFTTGPLY